MSSNQPSAKRKKLSLASIQVTTIKVLVGKDETSFSIYKHLICAESMFFKIACKDYWTCDEAAVRLVEDDPELFGIFITWLLTKDIEQAEDLVEVIETEIDARYSSFDARFDQLMRLFVLAQTLQAENFQNAAMDLMLTTCDQFCSESGKALASSFEFIKFAYENTLPKSPLRQMILNSSLGLVYFDDQISDIFEQLNSQNSDSDPNQPNKWAQEYLTELLNTMTTTIKWRHRGRCAYHEHRDKPNDYSCTEKNSQSALD